MNTNNKPVKYFIYARKSTESDGRQVLSIHGQLEDIGHLQKRLDLEIVDTFTDSASASIPFNRPNYAEMIRLIKKGTASGIIVWKVDRLARNHLEWGELMHLLQNGTIRSIWTPQREYQSSDSALLIALEASMATQYSRDLSERVYNSLHLRASLGQPPMMEQKQTERGNSRLANFDGQHAAGSDGPAEKPLPIEKEAAEIGQFSGHAGAIIIAADPADQKDPLPPGSEDAVAFYRDLEMEVDDEEFDEHYPLAATPEERKAQYLRAVELYAGFQNQYSPKRTCYAEDLTKVTYWYDETGAKKLEFEDMTMEEKEALDDAWEVIDMYEDHYMDEYFELEDKQQATEPAKASLPEWHHNDLNRLEALDRAVGLPVRDARQNVNDAVKDRQPDADRDSPALLAADQIRAIRDMSSEIDREQGGEERER